MKNPKTQTLLCVNCDIEYDNESNKLPKQSNNQSSKPSSNQSDSQSNNQSVNQSNNQLTILQPSPKKPISLPSPPSANSHIDESPRSSNQSLDQSVKSPLSSNIDDDDYSHLLRDRYDPSADVSIQSTKQSSNESNDQSNDQSNNQSTNQTVNSRADVPALLSEKLLAGWSMLASECPNPNCACPLVRLKQGPMMCVQCGSTVVTEEEAAKQASNGSKNQSNNQSTNQSNNLSNKPSKPVVSVTPPPSSSNQSISQPIDRSHSNNETKKRAAFADSVAEPSKRSQPRKSSNQSMYHSINQSINRLTSPPITPAPTPMPTNEAQYLPTSSQLSQSISSSFGSISRWPSSINQTNNYSNTQSINPFQFDGHMNMSGLGSPRQQSYSGFNQSSSQSNSQPINQMYKQYSSRNASGNLPTINSPGMMEQSISQSSTGTSPVNVPNQTINQSTSQSINPPINQLTSTQILHSSLESLYGKLEELRRALMMCSSIDQIAAIAAAMRECATAIHAIQATFTS